MLRTVFWRKEQTGLLAALKSPLTFHQPPNQHHFHHTEFNFSEMTQVNNEKELTDMLPSHEALH